MNTKAKKILKVIGIIILVTLAAYIIYLYASYHRIEDNKELQVETISDNTSAGDSLTAGEKYSALTYNIGFGAYTPDFSFFMDGGKSSWAKSKDSVKETIKGAGELVASKDPDFALVQEIDLDATRSYHVNEYSILKEIIPAYNCVSVLSIYPASWKKQGGTGPVFQISDHRINEKKLSYLNIVYEIF